MALTDEVRRSKLPDWAEADLFVKDMCACDLIFKRAVLRAKTEAEIATLKEQALFKNFTLAEDRSD